MHSSRSSGASFVVLGSALLLLSGCGSSGGGSTSTGGSGSAGTSGSSATAGSSGSGSSSGGSSGSSGSTGCAPQAKIIACWVGDAASPPGPGTHSASRCREYTGDNGSGPHQWDASCTPDATTHAISACPAGFTSRCVCSCGTAQEYVDFNYDNGGSSLLCQGSGCVWLQP